MEWIDWLVDVFSSRESLRIYIEGYGPFAPLAFIGLQALQVILAPIPGEMTGSVAGFVFGGAWGALYATVGLTLGSSLAFILGRLFGRPLIKYFVSAKTERKFAFMEQQQGALVVFFIFLIPGFPKDVMTYMVALSPMRTLPFIIISNLGRLPGTIMLTYAGSAAYEGAWGVLAGIGLLSAIVIALGYRYRGYLLQHMQNHD